MIDLIAITLALAFSFTLWRKSVWKQRYKGLVAVERLYAPVTSVDKRIWLRQPSLQPNGEWPETVE